MVKHIVFWKLKEMVNGRSKQENALKIKALLEDLNGKIPGMITLEVGIDFSKTENSADIALYSEFENKKSLDDYQENPLHKAVMPFIAEAREERKVIDYDRS